MIEVNKMNISNGNKEYKSKSHLIYSCQYHVIFCPKYRRQVLKEGVDVRLKEIFLAVSKEYDFEIVEMEVMPDHVHLLVDCNPRFGIMNCVTKLKGISSKIIKPSLKYLAKYSIFSSSFNFSNSMQSKSLRETTSTSL